VKLWIPPNTNVLTYGCRVVLIFRRERDAEAFAQWLKWVNDQSDGTELVITRPEEGGQVR
jgi:hypothetical protein